MLLPTKQMVDNGGLLEKLTFGWGSERIQTSKLPLCAVESVQSMTAAVPGTGL